MWRVKFISVNLMWWKHVVPKGFGWDNESHYKLYPVYLKKGDERSKIRYNQQKNIVMNALRIADYYNELFENTKDSTYNLWKNLGPVINPKKKRRGNYINKIIKDGKCMSDPHGIANALNEYFGNIGNELQAKFSNTDDQYLTYLPDEIMQNFFLQPITASQVKCEILKLNSKKSSGDDNIGAKIIQLCPYVFPQNLSKIYNDSISKGEYPQQMKIARVIALYKKGKK